MTSRVKSRGLIILAALLTAAPLVLPQNRAVAQGTGETRNAAANPDDGEGRRGRGGGRRNRGPDGNEDRGGPRRGPDVGESSQAAASAPAIPVAKNRFGGDPSLAERTREWARTTIRAHDKNGDMILDADEQSGLGQSKGADLDRDGKITVDELFAATMAKASGSSSNSTTSSVAQNNASSTPAVTQRDTKDSSKPAKPKRKSYRFTPGKDRLPAGLPSWFKSRDANGDGQVAMSEYSRSWSNRTAAEFQRYDKNNDGMVTAAEAR